MSEGRTVRRRDRQATERALVEAAGAEFSQNGYAATTTKGIAKRVGCSEALIQNYFGSKEGLLFAVIQAEARHGNGPPAFLQQPPGETTGDEVSLLLSGICDILRRRSEWLRILIERSMVDAAFSHQFADATPRHMIHRALEARLAKRRDLRVEPTVAAEIIVSTAFELGFVYPEILHRDAGHTDDLARAFAQVLASGLFEKG